MSRERERFGRGRWTWPGWLGVALLAFAPIGCDEPADHATGGAHDPHHAADEHAADEHAADEHHEAMHGEAHDPHAAHGEDPMAAHGDHPPADHDHPAAHGEHAHDEHAHDGEGTGGTARTLGRADGPAGDAVRAEMQALQAATQAIVSDVVNGQLDTLESRLRPVHGARQATVAAVEAHGYAPPGAPGDLAGFEAADDAFHESLVRLLNAARSDDLPETTRQLGVVLSGCTSCHQQYRFVETQ